MIYDIIVRGKGSHSTSASTISESLDFVSQHGANAAFFPAGALIRSCSSAEEHIFRDLYRKWTWKFGGRTNAYDMNIYMCEAHSHKSISVGNKDKNQITRLFFSFFLPKCIMHIWFYSLRMDDILFWMPGRLAIIKCHWD